MALLWVLVLHTMPTHECSHTHTLSTVLVFQECTLLSTHFFIMPDGFHLWHFTSNKTNYTVWMSTTRKKQVAFYTPPLVSHGRWKQVQWGVFTPRHTATHTHTHVHTQKQMSNASDSISFVYTFARTHSEQSDEATLCWWMFFIHHLNRHTSVFTGHTSEPGSRVGGEARQKAGGGERERAMKYEMKKKGDRE